MRPTLYQIAYHLLRLYWFLFRPRTSGARCIVLCGDHVLLIRQTYGERLWTFPGGGLARGETPEAAVRREVEEEVGVRLSQVRYVGRFVSTQTYNVDTVYVFTARAPSQALTLDAGEILAAHWFAREALPPVSGKTRTALELWRQHENIGAEVLVLRGENCPG